MTKYCPSKTCNSSGLNYPDSVDRCIACGEELANRSIQNQRKPFLSFHEKFWIIVMVFLGSIFILAAFDGEQGSPFGYFLFTALMGIGILFYILNRFVTRRPSYHRDVTPYAGGCGGFAFGDCDSGNGFGSEVAGIGGVGVDGGVDGGGCGGGGCGGGGCGGGGCGGGGCGGG